MSHGRANVRKKEPKTWTISEPLCLPPNSNIFFTNDFNCPNGPWKNPGKPNGLTSVAPGTNVVSAAKESITMRTRESTWFVVLVGLFTASSLVRRRRERSRENSPRSPSGESRPTTGLETLVRGTPPRRLLGGLSPVPESRAPRPTHIFQAALPRAGSRSPPHPG